MLVSPTRSGSTAFLRCFENNPDVEEVHHQPVKSGFRQDGTFDYGFFSLDEGREDKIFVAKETVGGFAPEETDFSPVPKAPGGTSIANRFPSQEAIDKVRPLFLFRDPQQTWNSINKLNDYSAGRSPFHSPFEYFITSYRNVFEFLMHAKSVTPNAHCLTLEELARDPRSVLENLCAKWNIRYHEQMVEWDLPYGERTQFSEETKMRMETDPRFMKSKEGLERSSRFEYSPSVLDIMTEHRERILAELQPLYENACELSEKDFRIDR